MGIDFKKTYYNEAEEKAVKDVLENGADYLSRSKENLISLYNTENIFLTSNGSLALDILLLAYAFPEGSEVILPSFTFPSAANSILRSKLVPVFCDIDPKTLVMDISDAKSRITDKTVCVIPTHYGGVSCDMDLLKKAFAGITIIEDAALSIGAKYNGKPLGTLGNSATISFHKTKNISAEEGGAIILNDTAILDKLEIIYENGTDRKAFINGEVPFYSWQGVGINAQMSNINAAVLSAQLDKLNDITAVQKSIYQTYMTLLLPLADWYGFSLPCVPDFNKNNAHVFYIMFDSEISRDKVKAQLKKADIGAVTHYVPLHQSPMGEKLGYMPQDLPQTHYISKRMLRLPMHAMMSIEDCEAIVEEIGKAL